MTIEEEPDHSKAQYEALGRFVEAFEALVFEVRANTIELLERGRKHRRLISIALHHGALTAKPLFDIYRAAVGEILSDALSSPESLSDPIWKTELGEPLAITKADQGIFFAVLNLVASEFETLYTARNNLLHATWFIGAPSPWEMDPTKLRVQKYTPKKSGLSLVDSLPKDAAELTKLAQRCSDTMEWIAHVHALLVNGMPIASRFQRSGNEWHLIYHSPDLPPPPLTLPRK